ncbi:LCP family protein [Candidatus Azambacteria bacterium]|nr:LCP family protein [Candidatus Azambacteria bacterium]
MRFITKKIVQTVRKWSWMKRLGACAAVFVLLFVSFFLFKVEKTFSLINTKMFSKVFQVDNQDDYQEKNRVNILIMGLRGKGDVLNGEYLTDTMMVLSIKTDANKAALFSIPRDLYVRVPGWGKMEKINFAYAYGKQTLHDGLQIATRVVERVAGVHIDYAIAVNFSSFMKLIDMVGGIDVYVPNDFSESAQWGFDFQVPKGVNHMNGETALYYSRSRYSSNDFDRARRQQDVLTALGNKVAGIGVFANPIKLSKMLDALSEGVDTDIDFISLLRFTKYAKAMSEADLARIVFDDSQNGLLVSGFAASAYVLYPKAGIENYNEIKDRFRSVFAK